MNSAIPNAMYSREHLCPELQCQKKCIRVRQSNEGKFDLVFHEHVPVHRLSQESELEALRCMAGHYSNWPGVYILQSLLNKRRGGPTRFPGFVYHTSYPEEGVLRQSVSTSQAWAWSDRVISKGTFRQRAVPIQTTSDDA